MLDMFVQLSPADEGVTGIPIETTLDTLGDWARLQDVTRMRTALRDAHHAIVSRATPLDVSGQRALGALLGHTCNLAGLMGPEVTSGGAFANILQVVARWQEKSAQDRRYDIADIVLGWYNVTGESCAHIRTKLRFIRDEYRQRISRESNS